MEKVRSPKESNFADCRPPVRPGHNFRHHRPHRSRQLSGVAKSITEGIEGNQNATRDSESYGRALHRQLGCGFAGGRIEGRTRPELAFYFVWVEPFGERSAAIVATDKDF